jgi:hypothetical protein
MKVSVFIPCVPEHIQNIVRIISAYENGTRKPDEYVIGLSRCKEVNIFTRTAIGTMPRTILIDVAKPLYAGPCQQLAEYFCNGDIIMYQAADDMPHERRVEIVKDYFKRYDIVALNHSYYGTTERQHQHLQKYDYSKIRVAQPRELVTYYREHPDDVYGQGFFRVGAGIICIRPKVLQKVKWGYERKGQDGIFCKKVLFTFQKSILIDAPLYWYLVHPKAK